MQMIGLGSNPQYQQFIAAKERRQREVIDHEHAHYTQAGPLAGAIEYDYDGLGYIVGGRTHVTLPGVDRANPEKSMALAQIAMNAAGAPGSDMSSQDSKVYAMASKIYFQAQQLCQKKQAGQSNEP